MADPSRTQQLVEAKLREPVVPWAMAQRPRSWRLIALDLRDATGMDIASETLRLWCADEEKARVEALSGVPA